DLNAHTAFNSHMRQESGGATRPRCCARRRHSSAGPRLQDRPGRGRCRAVRSAPVTWSRPRRTVPGMADHDSSAPATAPSDPADLTADVVVLGGGPVGENVAQYAIEGTGLTAVVVEGELLGGECSYYACIPSKALLRPPAVADTAAHLPGITTPQVDRDALLLRRDAWVSHYDDSGQVDWAEGAGIQVVRGHGRIVGEREVLVDIAGGEGGADGTDSTGGAGEAAAPTRIRARRAVVIATGSRAHVPGPLQEQIGRAACRGRERRAEGWGG